MKITEIISAGAAPVFISSLERAVAAIPQPRAPGQQWAQMIQNLQQRGLKVSEIEWTGILPWLTQQGTAPVTKDQVLQYLSSRTPNVQTVVHGVARGEVAPDEQAGVDHGPAWDALVQQQQQHETTRPSVRADGRPESEYKDWVDQSNGITDQMDQIHARMVSDTMARQNLSGRRPRYKGYTLPGGKDYREMLLTTPAESLPVQVGGPEPLGKDYGNTQYAANFGRHRVEGVTAYPFRIGSEEGHITYWPVTYDHMERPAPAKYIVNSQSMQNARFDTMEQAKEAIQTSLNSGYIGKGRKDVYRSTHWPGDANVIAHTRFDTRTDANGNATLHVAEIQSDWHQEGRRKGYKGDPINLSWSPYVNQNGNARPHLQIARDDKGREVGSVEQTRPSGWRASSADRGLGNFDTEDEAKNEVLTQLQQDRGVPNGPFKKEWPSLAVKRLIRYAIDHGIDRITWDVGKTHAKRYALSNHITDITLSGTGNNMSLSATDLRNRKVIDKQPVTPETLPDYIGKDAADKLLSQPDPDPSNPYGARSLNGLDLDIGGEGMQGFYDTMLPTMLNKYARKYGGSVTQTKVVASPDGEPDENPKRRRYAPAWELAITPAMKQAVTGGQPLWESLEF